MTSGGTKGSGATNLDTQNAKLLGQWIVGQVYPALIGGQTPSGGQINMNNMPANEAEKIGREVFKACNEYVTSGHFPNTVSQYTSSGGGARP